MSCTYVWIDITGWNNGGWPPYSSSVLDAESISAKILQTWMQDGPIYAYYSNHDLGDGKRNHLVVVTGAVSAYGHVDLVTTNNPWDYQRTQTLEGFISEIPDDDPQDVTEKMQLQDVRVPT
jgi:hypothetical protein